MKTKKQKSWTEDINEVLAMIEEKRSKGRNTITQPIIRKLEAMDERAGDWVTCMCGEQDLSLLSVEQDWTTGDLEDESDQKVYVPSEPWDCQLKHLGNELPDVIRRLIDDSDNLDELYVEMTRLTSQLVMITTRAQQLLKGMKEGKIKPPCDTADMIVDGQLVS